jgi:hypothetical protein
MIATNIFLFFNVLVKIHPWGKLLLLRTGLRHQRLTLFVHPQG